MNLSPSPKPQPQPRTKSWAISVRCRCRSLDLRVNAANVLPNWGTGGERISVFLRLKRVLLLTVESEFGELTDRDLRVEKKGRLRRLWGSFGKLFGRWRKGRSSRNGKRNRKVGLVKGKEGGDSERDENWWRYQASLVPIIGSLSLLFYSSTQRDHKGILIHAFSYLFYLVSFCKITESTQGSSIAIMILVCIAGFNFSYVSYQGFIAKAAHLVSNWICFLALIYLVFSKLISSSPTIPIERRRIKWCILIITSILVLLYKLRRGIPLFLIKIAFYGSRAWVSGLLLTTQALLQTLFGSSGKNYAFGALLSSAYFWGKEIANYLVPFLQVYIPKTLLDMTIYVF